MNTKEGGQNTKRTNIELYGKDYYQRIGALGGKAYHEVRGFQGMEPWKHQEASRKGGTISRRRKLTEV